MIEIITNNVENLGVFSISIVVVTIMGILSAASKPNSKQKISPTKHKLSSSKNKKNKKKFTALRGKHEFVHRPSLLDTGMDIIVPWRQDSPRSNLMKKSIFRGWYNLCWIIAMCWVLQYFMNNYIKYSTLIANINWFYSLFHFIHELIILILPIYTLSFSAYLLEKLMSIEIFGKKYTRPILHVIQHFLQTIMIFGVGTFVFFFCEHWPFTQKLALTMETLCLYMKMHSYMLSNQELYEMKMNNNNNNRKNINLDYVDKINDDCVKEELSKRGLRDFSSITIDSTHPAHFCYYVHNTANINIYGFSSCYKLRKTTSYSHDDNAIMTKNTPILQTSTSTADISEETDKIRSEIRKLREIETSKLEVAYMRMVLKDSIFLENYRKNIYPQNVTLFNFLEFTWLPTLVYEPLYPRTASVRILYVIEKILLSIAIMTFMIGILEQFILKPISNSYKNNSIQTIINLLVPATLLEVCAFFVVFDCILNCIAEITCFADREFYQDWWNSTSFEEFARKWNRPVHEFLLRHVYYESMNTYKLSKNISLIGTFIFSITLHEVVLSACFHRFSPWLAMLSLFQLPLMPIMKSPIFHKKPLGNIVFWIGIIIGMPMVCVLYAKSYCQNFDCSDGPLI